MMTSSSTSKRLQLLKETAPKVTRIELLWNPDHPFHSKVAENSRPLRHRCRSSSPGRPVRKPEQLDAAFSDFIRAKAQALYVVEDPIFYANQKTILELDRAAPAAQPSTS